MLSIRKANKKDTLQIAYLMLLAMEEIVFKFIGEKDHQKATAFLHHFVQQEDNQYSYQNCWVAEMDGTIAGMANVYDGADLHKLRKPIEAYIKSQYNPAFQPEDETKAGEYYIDTFAVDPKQQGNGIGAQLLQALIDEYVHKKSIVLGLLVDENNPGAKRLYDRKGFQNVGRKVLLGKYMEHLQVGIINWEMKCN